MGYKKVDANYVLEHLEDLPIVDVRPAEMYREGRIPNAVSIPFMILRDAGGNVAARVEAAFRSKGFDEDSDVIVYCLNGALANEVCSLLDFQGFRGVVCYEGSWTDWVSDPGRPVEK